MHIVYTGEAPPNSFTKSLFLAGPTPRSRDIKSWRFDALRILAVKGYDGVVFMPEDRNGNLHLPYEDQVKWEHDAFNMTDCILFWVPRSLSVLPGYTTNIEFGWWHCSGKIILGFPPDAEKMEYLDYVARKFMIPEASTLEETINLALKMIGDGVLRDDGERCIPLQIWHTASFQSWYAAQKDVGNRLDGAAAELVYRVGKNRDRVFMWIIHADVHIAAEGRNKTNELVIARTDISAVLLYHSGQSLWSTKIVLVKEFRSPCNTEDGYIHELPGGSSSSEDKNAFEIAAEELYEETGFRIDPGRLKYQIVRQLAGTFSAHKAHLFSAEIDDRELEWLENQRDIAHGTGINDPTGERTYVEVSTVAEITSRKLIDWSNIGMILSVIAAPS